MYTRIQQWVMMEPCKMKKVLMEMHRDREDAGGVGQASGAVGGGESGGAAAAAEREDACHDGAVGDDGAWQDGGGVHRDSFLMKWTSIMASKQFFPHELF
ncbi:hypothetical protein NE237_026721 [Protea cynaroides]|uniref:Uncharacterized protein n=1 Tax=Protea cynaroides TaxID=273540 RepID=A0A9Q0GM51_9MAGN|nr:hypothetical protein NE237_026721 [Protea cynaroides]